MNRRRLSEKTSHADEAAVQFELSPSDTKRLQQLCGPVSAHLRQIEAGLQVQIRHRGAVFNIHGTLHHAEQAAAVIQALYAQSRHGITAEEVQLALTETISGHHGNTYGRPHGGTHGSRHGRHAGYDPHGGDELDAHDLQFPHSPPHKAAPKARTPNQQVYLEAISRHDITFGIGPAGTGKTYLAVASAVEALERDAVQRIVLVRPAVEAGERLGFLPGDLAQKVDPYLRPLYDALYDLLGFDKTLRLIERQTIEIAPLAYMRGRTLNGAFIILDEAQNTTPEQMKMFLTRVGFGARVVVTGDTTQIDLATGQRSGLVEVETILQGVHGIAFTRFTSADVVRHPVVQRIVEAYMRHEERTPGKDSARRGASTDGKAGVRDGTKPGTKTLSGRRS